MSAPATIQSSLHPSLVGKHFGQIRRMQMGSTLLSCCVVLLLLQAAIGSVLAWEARAGTGLLMPMMLHAFSVVSACALHQRSQFARTIGLVACLCPVMLSATRLVATMAGAGTWAATIPILPGPLATPIMAGLACLALVRGKALFGPDRVTQGDMEDALSASDSVLPAQVDLPSMAQHAA